MVYTGTNYPVHEDHAMAHLNPAEYTGVVREVCGVFSNVDDLQEAIRDLEGTAFPRQDISVMGARGELEEVFGARTVPPEFAMDNADTPRQAPARPEEETIGKAALVGGGAYVGAMGLALAAGAIAFPVAGAAIIGGLGGGVLGGILTKLLGDVETRHIHEQVERGGLLLWVQTPDENKEDVAMRIMSMHGARSVHAHTIA